MSVVRARWCRGWKKRDSVGGNPGPLLPLYGVGRQLSGGAQAALLPSLTSCFHSSPARAPLHPPTPCSHPQQTQGSEARLQIFFWAFGNHQPRDLGLLFLETHQAVSILERTLERGRLSPVIQLTPESARGSTHVHSPLPSQQILGCLGPSGVRPNLLPVKGLVLGIENLPRWEEAREG